MSSKGTLMIPSNFSLAVQSLKLLVNQQMAFHYPLAICSFVLYQPIDFGAFCQKNIFSTFWRRSAWKWAKLALIYLKRLLQHYSITFFPLAPCLWHFCLGMGRNQNFEKVTFAVRLFVLLFFFLQQ